MTPLTKLHGAGTLKSWKQFTVTVYVAFAGFVIPALQVLVSRGANVSAVDFLGETALHKAARYGHLDIVEVRCF